MKPRLLAAFSIFISISLAAQSPRLAQTPKPYTFKAGPLNAGDVLRIKLFKAPNPITGAKINFAVNEVIRNDGTFNAPLLGNVPSVGQTLSEFLKMLEARYAEYFIKGHEADAEAFTATGCHC
jgi:protein involved in polysaccharide export with SLBB domain